MFHVYFAKVHFRGSIVVIGDSARIKLEFSSDWFYKQSMTDLEIKVEELANAINGLSLHQDSQNVSASGCACCAYLCGGCDCTSCSTLLLPDRKSLGLLVFWLILTGFSLFFIWVGVQADNHPQPGCTHNLPLWLMLTGVVLIVLSTLGIVQNCGKPYEQYTRRLRCSAFVYLLLAFEVVWLIVGSVYVFLPDSSDCNYSPSKIAQVCVIVLWSALGCVGCCCQGC